MSDAAALPDTLTEPCPKCVDRTYEFACGAEKERRMNSAASNAQHEGAEPGGEVVELSAKEREFHEKTAQIREHIDAAIAGAVPNKREFAEPDPLAETREYVDSIGGHLGMTTVYPLKSAEPGPLDRIKSEVTKLEGAEPMSGGDGTYTKAHLEDADPWIHRSTHMKCRTCMHYCPKTEIVGRCRRHAPAMTGYPVVYPDRDWCGDHKINEETLHGDS